MRRRPEVAEPPRDMAETADPYCRLVLPNSCQLAHAHAHAHTHTHIHTHTHELCHERSTHARAPRTCGPPSAAGRLGCSCGTRTSPPLPTSPASPMRRLGRKEEDESERFIDWVGASAAVEGPEGGGAGGRGAAPMPKAATPPCSSAVSTGTSCTRAHVRVHASCVRLSRLSEKSSRSSNKMHFVSVRVQTESVSCSHSTPHFFNA